MIRPIFYTTSPSKQLLILFFVLFASFVVFAIVSSFGMIAFPNNLDNKVFPIEYTQYLLVVQGVTMMIMPSIIFTFLTNLRPWHSIGMQTIKPIVWVLISIVAIVSIQPLVQVLGIWNSKLVLPDYLSLVERWMRESEANASVMMTQILQGAHIKNIIANILIMAIIPAIGEELIFRGCFQKVIGQWWRNPHLAIVFTALLFSAIHLQFFGFLPRFVLGLLLGYLFYWSKNIWVPIIAHFLNNLGMLLLYYYYVEYGDIENPLNVQTSYDQPWWWLALGTLSLAVTLFLGFKLYRRAKLQKGLEVEPSVQ